MIHINLLPVKKIKQQVLARKQLMGFGVALAAILGVLFFISLIVNGTIGGLKGEITVLENKKKQLAEVLKTIEEIEKKKALVETQTKIVEDLQKASSLTVRVLDVVSDLTINDRMWLTALNQSGNSMQLSGTALDNPTIAEFLDKLKYESKGYISNVVLGSSTLSGNLQTFALSCSVHMPPEKSPEEQNETVTP
jgi:type IV pilus assembly protein PilN